MLDEIDVGFPLVPFVEIRDPFGYTLFNQISALSSYEDAFIPAEFSTVPVLLDLTWYTIRYTVPGPYTFIVRWTGSPASREAGIFTLNILEPTIGGNYDG